MSARFFVRHVAPKVAARRAAAEAEDGALDGSGRRCFLTGFRFALASDV